MIVIVDCGIGNLSSVKNALDYLRADSKITSNPAEIGTAGKVILPGVGAFGFMMQSLKSKGLESPVKRCIEEGKPFLGICLGMQALFEESEESLGVKGMGIFKGKVVRFRKGKIPQIGWNKIVPAKPAKGSTRGSIFKKGFVYFVNSYYVVPEDETVVAATTDYFGKFASAIQYENVTAVQFHPEKSGIFGIELLRRWLKC